MNAVRFLAEWGLRSGALILFGGFLLWALRVKDSSVRLAAWTAILLGSLLIPMMSVTLPKVSIRVMPAARLPVTAAASDEVVQDSFVAGSRHETAAKPTVSRTSAPLDWGLLTLAIYGSIAFVLLVRLLIGMVLTFRILRRSRTTGQMTGGIEIRESEDVAAPVTLGILHPAIMLPVDWIEWEHGKLEAVLAHERSHVRRHDPAVQLISAIHRALLWHNPLSWFLHLQIVSSSEDASDDAAVAVTTDRVSYAEVLLDFM